ncbi:MAG: tartrate dehydrogenase/decarboxylase / D-malate dehydrogenase [Chloroflexi bacterium]|nr:MAG: tartrate dehydrogenase/decarboxylase / D-malate dehydrogenase [Chloroflexota bacterium]
MGKHRIAVLPGDGIGPEVIAEGIKGLRALEAKHDISFEFEEFPWSCGYYLQNGEMMPPDATDQLQPFDAVLFGAVGDPRVGEHLSISGLILPLRRRFDLFVNLRPNVLYPGVTSPLRDKEAGDINMAVVRENTEGEYADVGGFQYQGTDDEVAIQTGVFTRRGIERVVRYAFELAQRRDRKKVTSITKSNAQRYSMTLWDRVFAEVAAEFPDITTQSLLVDAAAMDFVRRPEIFDVVVASNLFADILTDLAAAITGSIGLAASANIDPTRRNPSVFEPIHGSAPDIAGKGIANPLATLLSAAMMLDHLDEPAAASTLNDAVKSILSQGEILTPDLGGKATTIEVGDAVAAEVR